MRPFRTSAGLLGAILSVVFMLGGTPLLIDVVRSMLAGLVFGLSTIMLGNEILRGLARRQAKHELRQRLTRAAGRVDE